MFISSKWKSEMERAYDREILAAHRLGARAVLSMLRIIKREGAPRWSTSDRDNMIEHLRFHRRWMHRIHEDWRKAAA